MQTVRTGPFLATAAVGLLAQCALLSGLAATVGLDGPGWVIGLACALAVNGALAVALRRDGEWAPGPADWVTLARATLIGAVAALVADSFARPAPVAVTVALASVALVLDAVDGRVARRTGTASARGARFDMEVDAFGILVLAVYDVRIAGGWVLLIGAARYGFVAAGWLLPWLARPTPPRYWCKVVAATQGVVLTVAMTDLLPRMFSQVLLGLALVLLAESFGRQAWWLWRHREAAAVAFERTARDETRRPRGRVRRTAAGITTLLAVLLVWFALVAPGDLSRLNTGAFVRIPIEGVVLVALLLVLPPKTGRIVTVVFGSLLGVLTIVKILDMGFVAAIDRPFNPMSDLSYIGPAIGVLDDSIGRAGTVAAAIGAVILVLAIAVLVPLSVRRLGRRVIRHRTTASRFVAAFALLWVVSALVGFQVSPGSPIASASAAALASAQVGQIRDGIADQQTFAAAISDDPVGITAGANLLTALRGKDVIFAFVESYGRVAVQGSPFAPGVGAVLDAGTKQLQAAGFASQSAFLTSPTFGGISWLAHSTLQSGLWVDSQLRYNELVASDRFTLSDAFKRAGWRTVGDVPSNYKNWPEGTSFYHYTQLYDESNVGYRGPTFSYADMPDQYILSAFQRNELANPQHAPVMAEIDLVSSHTPWAPLPTMVDWNSVGNGTVFDSMPAQGRTPADVWSEASQVGVAYGQSIEYSLNTLISFVQHYGNNNLVLVLLGDHQPAAIVSGQGASHDVPITVIAHDPAVMNRIAGWNWQSGMKPGPAAPVWPMDAFRNKFLKAFGS